MTEERRWYVRYQHGMDRTHITHAILHSHDGKKYPERMVPGKLLFEAELAPIFWTVPLSEIIEFFENGKRPRIRISCTHFDTN